jgi:chromatin segregation and condensation protein Rec8/ScpA/Scc1 (kleisin family)
MLEVLEPERFTRADWEELFREATRGLDPWALDLTALIGRFREFLQEKPVEMRIPGRMIFASSVLLRMKSEQMERKPSLAEAVDVVLAAEEEEDGAGPEVYVAPELRLPLRRRPRARLTLSDLRRAFLAAMAKSPRPSRSTSQEKPLRVEEEPFSLRALNLLRKLLSLVNGHRVIPFSRILERGDPKERVARFMELLHLAGTGKVQLFQQEFLGEIYIEVPYDPAQSAG